MNKLETISYYVCSGCLGAGCGLAFGFAGLLLGCPIVVFVGLILMKLEAMK